MYKYGRTYLLPRGGYLNFRYSGRLMVFLDEIAPAAASFCPVCVCIG